MQANMCCMSSVCPMLQVQWISYSGINSSCMSWEKQLIYALRQRYFAFLHMRPYIHMLYFGIPCSPRESYSPKVALKYRYLVSWSIQQLFEGQNYKCKMNSDVIKCPTRWRRTLRPPSFPVCKKESRVFPRFSSPRETFSAVVKWFDGQVSRQWLMCSTVKLVSRSIERDVDVNKKSHRSSRKGHPRLPLYVPNVFEGVSVLQRDKRSRKTSKTLAKLLA